MRNKEICSERSNNLSRATQWATYSQTAPSDPFSVLLYALGSWHLLWRASPAFVSPLTLIWVCSWEGPAKVGGRTGWSVYVSALFTWSHSLAEVVRPLFLSCGLSPKVTEIVTSPSCSPSPSRPGGGSSVDSFPLLLESGCFPTLSWSSPHLCKQSLHWPLSGTLWASTTSFQKDSLTSRANANQAGIWTSINPTKKPGLFIMMLHCVVGHLSLKGEVYDNHSLKKKVQWPLTVQFFFHQCPWQLSPENPIEISCHAIFLSRDYLLVERSELNKSLGGFDWFQSVMVSRWLCQDSAFWQVLWNQALGQPVL